MVNKNEPVDSMLGIIRTAINIEKFGIRYYSALSSAVENDLGKRFLEYLINAEEDHQRTLEQKFDDLKQMGDDALRPLPLDNLDEDGDLAIFAEPLADVDPKDVGPVEAVKYGIHAEERSIKFYRNAAKIVSDTALKEIFDDLVRFEVEHLELLKKNLKQIEEDGSWVGCER